MAPSLMPKTERLYYNDSFLYRFDGTVVEAAPVSAGRMGVVLDRTALYPTSGGQPFDTGILRAGDHEYRVVDVIDREQDDAIVHVVESAAGITPAMKVSGEIDEQRRRNHMQQHSGQHVLSAAFIELFGFPTVSFHLGDEVCTIDLDAASATTKQIEEAERLANRVVTDDRPVEVRYASLEEAQQMGVRKLPPRTGTIRLIDIRNFDLTACGGTHVRSTGQIGAILLRKTEKVKQGTRVEFVCGERAVRASRREYLALTQAAEVLSTATADLPAQVARLSDERKAAAKNLTRLLEQLAEYEARQLVAHLTAGTRLVEKHYADRDTTYAKLIAKNAITAGAAAALVTSSVGTPAIVLAANTASGLNAGALLKQVLTEAGGRGGGTAELAQGGVADQEKLAIAIASIRKQLEAA